MIVIAGFLLGAVLGAVVAKRRKGNLLDMLQYAFVYAIALSIVALFITIFIDRAN